MIPRIPSELGKQRKKSQVLQRSFTSNMRRFCPNEHNLVRARIKRHGTRNFRYDPKTNQWSSDVAPTSTCRTSVGVAVLDGLLYAVGGQDGVSCLNIVERFVFLANSLTRLSLYSYDARQNTWQKVAPMSTRRLGVSVCVLNGCLYAVGGSDGQNPLNTVERQVLKVSRKAFRYDPRMNKWTVVRPMCTRRKHLGAAVYRYVSGESLFYSAVKELIFRRNDIQNKISEV